MTCFSCASDSLFSFSNSCDFVRLRVTSCDFVWLGDFGCRKLFEKSGTIILPWNPKWASHGFPSPVFGGNFSKTSVHQKSHGNHGSPWIFRIYGSASKSRLEKDWVELLSIAEFSSNCIIYIYICICICVYIYIYVLYIAESKVSWLTANHCVFGWMLVSPNPMSLGMHLHLDETRTRCTLSSRLKSLVTKESLNLSHMVDNSTIPSHGLGMCQNQDMF